MTNHKNQADYNKESVWDYPRPPRVEDCIADIIVIFNGVAIVETCATKRVLETSHAPVYYIHPEDIRMEYLDPTAGGSWCEWKGKARYYSVRVNEKVAKKAAWSYPYPSAEFLEIKNYLAFYPRLMDACFVNGEKVTPQPGEFYGGWITSNITGPFKGDPDTLAW